MSINQISWLPGLLALLWRAVDWWRAQNRYTKILYDVKTMEGEDSFYTAISFVNSGTISATDVKIRVTYPSDTRVLKTLPPIKRHISKDENATVIEFNIIKIDASPRPFTLAILTDKEPDENFDIQVHEDKGVKTLPYNSTKWWRR